MHVGILAPAPFENSDSDKNMNSYPRSRRPKRVESVCDGTDAASQAYIVLRRTGNSLYVFLFTFTALKSMK
jgi:hypothetical protein